MRATPRSSGREPRIGRAIRERAEARDAAPDEVRRAEYTGDVPLSETVTPEEMAAAVASSSGRGPPRHRRGVSVDSGMAWY